jgi:hypothetical protein
VCVWWRVVRVAWVVGGRAGREGGSVRVRDAEAVKAGRRERREKRERGGRNEERRISDLSVAFVRPLSRRQAGVETVTAMARCWLRMRSW